MTYFIAMNKHIAALGVLAALATGCGSGSSGTRPPAIDNDRPPTVGGGSNSSNGNNTTPDTEWTKGVYEPSSKFKNFCASPRSGINPFTNDPYPDKQGEVAHENHFLRSWSDENYLWYDELQDLDPNAFSTATVYFSLLKTRELTPNGSEKDRFHFTQDELESEQLTYAGETGGYGFNWLFTTDGKAYIIYIDEGSPAAIANISRGMELKTVDGIVLENITNNAQIARVNAALFPELGESHTFEFTTLTGTRLSKRLTATTVTISPVLLSKTLNTPYGLTGYIALNTFNSIPAQDQLQEVFESFSASGIDDLIVDLRYNGGGLVTLSSQLAYLTAGNAATENETFTTLQYNDKRAEEEVSVAFYPNRINYDETPPAWGAPLTPVNINRVYVLTTDNTCSASESYINGLRGIGFNVIQIGDTTCGKPYGFQSVPNCGIEYSSINFESVNAEGFGDYSDGFEPVSSGSDPMTNKVLGCKAKDDLSQPLGSINEGLLSVALFHSENGRCPTPSQGQQKTKTALHVKGHIPVPESQKILRLAP